MIVLTDRQFGAMMWALRRIAVGTKIGAKGEQSSRLSRATVDLMARDVCDRLGWSYDRTMREEYVSLFGPDDRPPPQRPSQSEFRAAHKKRFIRAQHL